MKRYPVDSSNVVSIGYDDVLEVELKGGLYRYRGVPRPLYLALMAAESKGRFINQEIKNNYPCEKVA
jgi:KTSC domain